MDICVLANHARSKLEISGKHSVRILWLFMYYFRFIDYASLVPTTTTITTPTKAIRPRKSTRTSSVTTSSTTTNARRTATSTSMTTTLSSITWLHYLWTHLYVQRKIETDIQTDRYLQIKTSHPAISPHLAVYVRSKCNESVSTCKSTTVSVSDKVADNTTQYVAIAVGVGAPCIVVIVVAVLIYCYKVKNR